MSLDLGRQQLGQRQEALLRSLVAGAPAPAGFPEARLVMVRRSLASKRRREALASWPSLAKALGPQAHELFDAYAGTHPRPAGGCPRMDGYAFCRWLAPQGVAPAVEIVAHWRPGSHGLELRPSWQRTIRRAQVRFTSWWR